MSLPFVSEEDKVKENDIYLRMGTTNQLELIMLDSAGRIQRYYILVLLLSDLICPASLRI